MGTLGFVTEATFKLLPKPESEATIVIRRLDDARAVAAMTRALGSPFGVSGAATLSPGMGREFSRTFLRVEGFADSVDYRAEKLIALLAEFGAEHALKGEDSQRLWRAVRDAEFLAEPRERAIWRVSVKPSRRRRLPRPARAASRWRISSIGAAASSGWRPSRRRPTPPPCAPRCAPFGGHATLVRAPDALRARRRLRAATPRFGADAA